MRLRDFSITYKYVCTTYTSQWPLNSEDKQSTDLHDTPGGRHGEGVVSGRDRQHVRSLEGGRGRREALSALVLTQLLIVRVRLARHSFVLHQPFQQEVLISRHLQDKQS